VKRRYYKLQGSRREYLRLSGVVLAGSLFVKVASSADGDYHFESGSFATEMWIKNKAVFTKPVGVDVEFVTAGAFDWVFADASGKEVRTLRHTNEHGGWTSMNFASLGLFGDYSIGFRNASAGNKQIKQGDVRLK
jgi:hypothetical protein